MSSLVKVITGCIYYLLLDSKLHHQVTMMLERKQILPNGYFKSPSSRIEFEKHKLRVPVEVEDMVAHDAELGIIASISSFGFGGQFSSRSLRHYIPASIACHSGSCGHTVLREHEPRPVLPDNAALQAGPFLFAIGTSMLDGWRTDAESYPARWSFT